MHLSKHRLWTRKICISLYVNCQLKILEKKKAKQTLSLNASHQGSSLEEGRVFKLSQTRLCSPFRYRVVLLRTNCSRTRSSRAGSVGRPAGLSGLQGSRRGPSCFGRALSSAGRGRGRGRNWGSAGRSAADTGSCGT